MMLLANLEPVRWFFLAAAFGVVFWLLLRTQRQLQRTRSAAMERPGLPEWGANQRRSVPATPADAGGGGIARSARLVDRPVVRHPASDDPLSEIRQAEVQLHELARSLIAQLDSKAALLAGLLREARAEAARLEHLLAAAPARRASTQAASLASAASTRCDMPHDVPPPPSATTRPLAEIHRLADLGLTPAQIAERTHCPQGEVELILGLRKHSAS